MTCVGDSIAWLSGLGGMVEAPAPVAGGGDVASTSEGPLPRPQLTKASIRTTLTRTTKKVVRDFIIFWSLDYVELR